MLDRIDLHITVPNLTYEKLESGPAGEPSSNVRGRVAKARAIQDSRFKNEEIFKNSEMSVRLVKSHAVPDDAARDVLRSAVEKYALSARGYHRLLKVARTIADLEAKAVIGASHVLEALRYRPVREI